MLLEFVNKTLAVSTILSEIFLVTGILYLVFSKKSKENKLLSFFGKYGILFGFLVAVSSTVLSLFYSDYIGYEPCKLCWLQRIFIYPQVILLGMALWRKDSKIIDYSLAIASIGTVIAIYHLYISYGGTELVSCGATAVSCTREYVREFGFVTIPVMSFTGFLLTHFFLRVQKYYEKLTV